MRRTKNLMPCMYARRVMRSFVPCTPRSTSSASATKGEKRRQLSQTHSYMLASVAPV